VKILVTGDDGLFAEGLWALVKELKSNFDVMVVVPDRKLNAVGTAVTADRPIRAKPVKLEMAEVETWAVEGTPSDCILLAIYKLAKDEIEMVVSGINEGPNQSSDIFASGTVAAALTACLCGVPAIAISQDLGETRHLDSAARLAALLVGNINSGVLPTDILLNVNVPNLPMEGIKGIKITRMAGSDIYEDSVEEGGGNYDKDHGIPSHYSLARRRVKKATDKYSDVWAVQRGYVSITSLHTWTGRKSPHLPKHLCSDLFQEFKRCKLRISDIGLR
jgi:5'-nucleotidase